MPIYRGDNLISDVKLGGQNIANVYHGNVSVFSRNLLPYRVRIMGDGISNTYNSSGINFDVGFDAYFSLDNTTNIGNTWYGVGLPALVFSNMLSTNNDQTFFSILKDAWHNFISLYIGFDITTIDFNSFNISDPFYALNLNEWNSDGTPKNLDNTHAWVFEDNGNYYDVTYKVLDGTDFHWLSNVLTSATLSYFSITMLGQVLEFSNDCVLISAQNVEFINTYGDMIIEFVTNNGDKVNSTLVQSLTNNFNFQVRSMILGCVNEVMRLNWSIGTLTTVKVLQIDNYIPPQENVPGTLTTTLINLLDLLGE